METLKIKKLDPDAKDPEKQPPAVPVFYRALF